MELESFEIPFLFLYLSVQENCWWKIFRIASVYGNREVLLRMSFQTDGRNDFGWKIPDPL